MVTYYKFTDNNYGSSDTISTDFEECRSLYGTVPGDFIMLDPNVESLCGCSDEKSDISDRYSRFTKELDDYAKTLGRPKFSKAIFKTSRTCLVLGVSESSGKLVAVREVTRSWYKSRRWIMINPQDKKEIEEKLKDSTDPMEPREPKEPKDPKSQKPKFDVIGSIGFGPDFERRLNVFIRENSTKDEGFTAYSELLDHFSDVTITCDKLRDVIKMHKSIIDCSEFDIFKGLFTKRMNADLEVINDHLILETDSQENFFMFEAARIWMYNRVTSKSYSRIDEFRSQCLWNPSFYKASDFHCIEEMKRMASYQLVCKDSFRMVNVATDHPHDTEFMDLCVRYVLYNWERLTESEADFKELCGWIYASTEFSRLLFSNVAPCIPSSPFETVKRRRL